MSMSSSLHTDSVKADIEVSRLHDCEANVIKVEDNSFNQVALFMSLEQMQELADKLINYIELQGGIQ